ncbi:MAG TPA: L-histidine N(alpha)-methyltransferase [Stellaceae bacterium]|nr:L-histidine N(alpha)-methyltransferase [Stellaceae bacterium]
MRQGGALAAFHDLAPAEESFRDAVLGGLARRAKSIPCRFLYDERGSALFEEICELPEYYLTRTEIAILADCAEEIGALAGRHAQLIEFGSGASRKVRLLLDALEEPAAYVAIDISREPLRRAAEEVAADFPEVPVVAVCADYLQPLRLPTLPARGQGRRLGFFPGSTIGNFTPEAAVDFLAGCRRVIERGGVFVVGVDLKKAPALLDAAYNDSAGVTAAFNLNLLERINRELDADFDLDRFAHDASYNEAAGRIEIFIRSRADQIVTVAGRAIRFAEGERIHTEDSCKYTIAEFQRLAARSGFRPLRHWTDPAALFSVHLLSAI